MACNTDFVVKTSFFYVYKFSYLSARRCKAFSTIVVNVVVSGCKNWPIKSNVRRIFNYDWSILTTTITYNYAYDYCRISFRVPSQPIIRNLHRIFGLLGIASVMLCVFYYYVAHVWSRNPMKFPKKLLVIREPHRERMANCITWMSNQDGSHVTRFLQFFPCLWSFDAHTHQRKRITWCSLSLSLCEDSYYQ